MLLKEINQGFFDQHKRGRNFSFAICRQYDNLQSGSERCPLKLVVGDKYLSFTLKSFPKSWKNCAYRHKHI